MFDHLCCSVRPSAQERLTHEAKRQAGHLAHQAKDAALLAGTWAAPRAQAAVEWAGPRVEKAWKEGKQAAAPTVEHVAERALPLVDRTHDRLVDDVLPKLVAAVNAAAAATAVGADRARDVASARLTEIAHIPAPKKSHAGARVFWSIAGLAVVGALIAAWRSTRPTTDPWAEEPWETTDRGLRSRAAEARDELGDAVADVRHELGDAAEAVGEVAGEALARTREATEKVAERAREVTKKATPRRRASTSGAETTPTEAGATDAPALPVTDAVPAGDADAGPTRPRTRSASPRKATGTRGAGTAAAGEEATGPAPAAP